MLYEVITDAERGAFFGSISATLNHLAVGDRIWLQRFATHPACGEVLRAVAELPAPTGLDQRLFDDFAALAAHRRWLDGQILAWVAALVPADLDWPLDYCNTRGVAARRHYGALMLHFFNHQTHHRGQVVITSYSIHYTKLYEDGRADQHGDRAVAPGAGE